MELGQFYVDVYLQKIWFSVFSYVPDEVSEGPHIEGFLYWDLF